jgi:hypothetical protein
MWPSEQKEYKQTEDGVYYRIVTIEGRQYVATPGAYGTEQLAGPIQHTEKR